MESRADFQRLLEEMDRVIQAKRRELVELDERLNTARSQLSEQEAKELQSCDDAALAADQTSDLDKRDAIYEETFREQRKLLESQLEKFSAELGELETINHRLVTENKNLLDRLKATETALGRLESDLKESNQNHDEVKSANLELNLRLARAENESLVQQKLLQRSHDEDEVLIAAFSDKIESLRRIIDEKEREVERLLLGNQLSSASPPATDSTEGAVNFQASGRINSSTGSQGGPKSLDIANTLKDKDAQIELLKEHLLQANRELDKRVNQIERFSRQREKAKEKDDDEEHRSNLVQINMLESELEAKDKKLHELESRNYHYEMVLPTSIGHLINDLRLKLTNGHDSQELSEEINRLANSIRELLARMNSTQSMLDHVEQLGRVIVLKDTQISKLVRELNQLDAKQSLYEHKNRLLGIRTFDQPIETENTTFDSAQRMSDSNERDIAKKSDGPIDGLRCGSQARELIVEEPLVVEDSGNQEGRDLNFNKSIDAFECQVSPPNDSKSFNSSCVQPLSTKSSESTSASTRHSQAKSRADVLSDGGVRPDQTNLVHNHSLPSERNCVPQGHSNEAVSISELIDLQAHKLTGSASPSSTTSSNERVDHQDFQSSVNVSTMTQTSLGTETTQTKAESTLDRPAEENLTDTLRPIMAAGELESGRLRQLEIENELLELAMKEILLSIKWSDARCSTILIDCPSLERLCKLIEARFITKLAGDQTLDRSNGYAPNDGTTLVRTMDDDKLIAVKQTQESSLFQFIVLKSELDLLRGQNEQLRADVKLMRQEHRQLLARPVNSDSAATTSLKDQVINGMAVGGEGQQTDDGDDRELSVGVGISNEQTKRNLNNEDGNVLADLQKFKENNHLISGDEKTGLLGSVERSNNLSVSQVTETAHCPNCSRWAKATYHLAQSIVRVERIVGSSDEAYSNRLASLYHLIRMLERDLTTRESLLERKSHECHTLRQQRLMAESKLKFLEGQMTVHMHVCPLIMGTYQPAIDQKLSPLEQFVSSSTNRPSRSIRYSGTSEDGGFVTANARTSTETYPDARLLSRAPNQQFGSGMTINLLQSIIGCLQARLDYKDERLHELELALSLHTRNRPPVALPRQSLSDRAR